MMFFKGCPGFFKSCPGARSRSIALIAQMSLEDLNKRAMRRIEHPCYSKRDARKLNSRRRIVRYLYLSTTESDLITDQVDFCRCFFDIMWTFAGHYGCTVLLKLI